MCGGIFVWRRMWAELRGLFGGIGLSILAGLSGCPVGISRCY